MSMKELKPKSETLNPRFIGPRPCEVRKFPQKPPAAGPGKLAWEVHRGREQRMMARYIYTYVYIYIYIYM